MLPDRLLQIPRVQLTAFSGQLYSPASRSTKRDASSQLMWVLAPYRNEYGSLSRADRLPVNDRTLSHERDVLEGSMMPGGWQMYLTLQ